MGPDAGKKSNANSNFIGFFFAGVGYVGPDAGRKSNTIQIWILKGFFCWG